MVIRYNIKKAKGESSSIYVRAVDSKRLDLQTRTGLKVNPDHWNGKKQEVKQKVEALDKDFVNNHLRSLRTYLLETYNIESNTPTIQIGKDWLKQKVNIYFGKTNETEDHKIYFLDYLEDFIQQAKDGKIKNRGTNFSENRVKNYTTTLNRLKDYEKHKNTRLKFEDISLKFYHSMVYYFNDIQGYGLSTIGAYIKDIKALCRRIEQDKLPINQDYKHSDFVRTMEETQDTYLREEEIKKIFEYDFSHAPYLNNARGLFILALWTGLRVGDLMELDPTNIEGDTITVTTGKTKKKVTIPLHPQVKAILQKGKTEGLHTISKVNFNLYIKEICKAVKINDLIEGKLNDPEKNRKVKGNYEKWKLISAHTCRRSFATNLYGKIPNQSIMAITGHSTEAMLEKYIKNTNDEHALKVLEMWKEEQQNKPFVSVLKRVN